VLRRLAVTASGLALLAIGFVSPATAQEPARAITRVTGDLYRAQSGNAFTVFLVTPEGIILADPLSLDFSEWLGAELDSRFGVPVRYVLYTHHHWDHASGGAVFASTAELIGHEAFPGYLESSQIEMPLPSTIRQLDTNRDGRIQRGEATGALSAQFDLYDADGDGVLTGAEIARGPLRDVHPPTRTFSDRQEVTLGGRRAIMVHAGTAHSRDMSVILFPEDRVLFGTDLIQIRRLPIGVDPTLGEWMDAYRTLASLEYDTVVPGHGEIGSKTDIVAFLQYLEDLGTAVAQGVGRGMALEEIQTSVELEAYRGWERYESMLPLHIEQVYRIIRGLP